MRRVFSAEEENTFMFFQNQWKKCVYYPEVQLIRLWKTYKVLLSGLLATFPTLTSTRRSCLWQQSPLLVIATFFTCWTDPRLTIHQGFSSFFVCEQDWAYQFVSLFPSTALAGEIVLDTVDDCFVSLPLAIFSRSWTSIFVYTQKISLLNFLRRKLTWGVFVK